MDLDDDKAAAAAAAEGHVDVNMDEDEEEEEEEKEQFFADIVPSDRDDDGEREGLDVDDDAVAMEPAAAPSTGATPAVAEQERRAQIGASPYLAPFTPLSSPTRPKTPSSVSAAQAHGSKRKPQLVPIKNGPAFGPGGGALGAAGGVHGGAGAGGVGSTAAAAKVLKEDVVQHLPAELVEALMGTVQTLDKLILGVEDFRAEQLGFMADKVNAYVELLRRVDTTAANYHAPIPLQVLEMLDAEEQSNPELFTKTQLEKCQNESQQAAGKVDTLQLLKAELEGGLAAL